MVARVLLLAFMLFAVAQAISLYDNVYEEEPISGGRQLTGGVQAVAQPESFALGSRYGKRNGNADDGTMNVATRDADNSDSEDRQSVANYVVFLDNCLCSCSVWVHHSP
ncbi:uncharacterized protein LOC124721215 isoform X2 [Schistocerca piceifrons]|uniref:uncharacterized protein LOC124721215 isoform X2 n=1 Tax=Schistocerca piceifrons TaxID=274613 RepID=UPI001F5E81AD|nr:uncharacterized protein LOC124721215 isoform X2 [Schistocerca piceifrons]